jgi:raffinose/stachyose/melibiose transport system permease protein
VYSSKIGDKLSNNVLKKNLGSWLFILPILIIHLFVVALPAISTIYLSMTEWSGVGLPKFTGLTNIKRLLFDDDNFISALKNNIRWLAFFLTIPFVMSLSAAYGLSQIKRGVMFYRISLFLPYILPSVIVGALWGFLLNPSSGLTGFLDRVGVPGFDKALLGTPDTALWAIAFIDNWHFWGFLTILFLVALQNVPRELYESAELDGANEFQRFRYVALPGIRPTLVFMLMMVGIWSFLVFDYVWVLTKGGPAGSTEVLGTLVYRTAFGNSEAGYATLQGLGMAFFASASLIAFGILRKRGWEI